MNESRTAWRVRLSLAVAGVGVLVAALFVVAAISRHDEPRLSDRELAASRQASEPTAVSPFAFDHLDLECQMGRTKVDKPHGHLAPPSPGSGKATETTFADVTKPAATAPAAVRQNERLRHDPQRSAQDVVDNITAYFDTYSDRGVARLAIEVTDQHGDSAQFTGRLEGRLQFLATAKHWPDGTWDWLDQITCDELWVTA